MAVVDKSFSRRDVLLEPSTKPLEMQPSSLTGRQQQLGLLIGRSQPDMIEAARVAALLNGQSGSFNLHSGLGTGLGSGSLAGLGGAPAGLNLSLGSLQPAPQPAPQSSQLAFQDQLTLLGQFPPSLFPQQYGSVERDLQLNGLRNVGKTRSSDSRSSSAYASRHQAAEQRRRTRINERLELLRKLVPHAERANTACFLEEVIKYIEALKRRTLELEAMLETATGKPVAKSLALPGVVATPGSAIDPGSDSQAPSPRLPASASGQGAPSTAQQLLGGQVAQNANAGGTSSSPLLQPASMLSPPAVQPPTDQASQHQQPSPLVQGLHLSPAAAAQLAQLLPSSQLQQQQQSQHQPAASSHQQQLLLPHTGSGLSLGASGGPLSLGGTGGGSVSLAHLTAGLAAQHGLSQHPHGHLTAHHHHHHHVAQQLSELQSMHVMQTMQQNRLNHPPIFHPTNNKAFLHFNEDLFGGIKPELLPSRSLVGAAASTTPSTSLQLTTAQVPTDSNTLMHMEATTRKTLSGSPVSSEESGVPLKKRKVLLL